METPLTLETPRLRLVAMTHAALQAWLDGDAARLRVETGATFAEPVDAPPLFDEDLPRFRDRMAETPQELGWWVWLVCLREGMRAVGVCGLGGWPGPGGVAVLGYAVYPREEGRGYATEASRALVAWVLRQDGVRVVRATVPAWNKASEAVARKVGMRPVGFEVDPGVGEVAVYEIRRLT